MKQTLLIIPPGALIAGPPGATGPAGAPGPAGASGRDGGDLVIPRSAVAGGSNLGASDVGRVLFFGEVDLSYAWRTSIPSTPLYAAVITKVSADADPMLTIKVVIIANSNGQIVTVPAGLVAGEPSYDGFIDVYDAGAGDYRLGATFTGLVGSTAIRVKSAVGLFCMGVTEVSV